MAYEHRLDIVYVGNYTKDTIITPTEKRYVDGGAVNYAAHAAVRLGVKVGVVTRLSREDNRMIAALQAAGVICFPEYTPTSTLMQLEYKTNNMDQRTLSVAGTAGTIDPGQMVGIQARAIVVGSSLRGEVEPAFFKTMRRRKGVTLGADMQGFMRVLRGQSLVNEPWPEMPEVLANLDILKSDMVEAEFLTGETEPARAARRYASLGPREIVLTYAEGVLIHAEGKDYHFPFFAGELSGRSGRGDTCLGSYAAMRLSLPPQEAGRWAAAVTSLKLQKVGTYDCTMGQLQDFLTTHYPV